MYAGVAVVLLTTLIVGSVHGVPIFKDQNVKGNGFIQTVKYLQESLSRQEEEDPVPNPVPNYNISCPDEHLSEVAWTLIYLEALFQYYGSLPDIVNEWILSLPYDLDQLFSDIKDYLIVQGCQGLLGIPLGGSAHERRDLITEGLVNKGTKEDVSDMLGRILKDMEQAAPNRQGKLQKHQNFVAEVDDNLAQIDSVKQAGNDLINADHDAKDTIAERLEELKDLWRTL